ncbi:MAG: hypothetical protein ACREE4_12815 [Stellaceae bacterium]
MKAIVIHAPHDIRLDEWSSGAETALPLNMFVAKELTLRGTFRFHEEFAWAVDFIARRKTDVRPLLSAVLPVSEARRAFDLASDRRQSMKVQIAF